MRRRDDHHASGAAVAWPCAAGAEGMPAIEFLTGRAPGADAHLLAAFREGFKEAG